MARAAVLLLLAGSSLLLASTARARASVEAGEGALDVGLPSLDVLTDRIENLMNLATEQAADVPLDVAGANMRAGLQVIQQAEGTFDQADPYRVCFGYSHTIQDFSEHPAITREWRGVRLADQTCINAGFSPGCISTAAGAYQIKRGTWVGARDALGLLDFSPASQDRAALYLIEKRGALEDLKAGRFDAFVSKCRNEWASLPGNYAKQGQRSLEQLVTWYRTAGGNLA